jgi:hypothetical protein
MDVSIREAGKEIDVEGLILETDVGNRRQKPNQYDLAIHADQQNYTLSLNSSHTTSYSHQHYKHTVPVSQLITSPPVGGAFTGMMFGLYAFGNGEPCLDPADFWDVEMVTDFDGQ